MKKARIHYPLAERHADTLKYMNNLDWDRIRKCIHKDIVAHFDISNAVDNRTAERRKIVVGN